MDLHIKINAMQCIQNPETCFKYVAVLVAECKRNCKFHGSTVSTVHRRKLMAWLKVLGNRPIFAFGANMVRVVDDYAATYLHRTIYYIYYIGGSL